PAHIQGMGIPDAVLAVPACDHRDAKFLRHFQEQGVRSGQTDAVSRIEHRAAGTSHLFDNLQGSLPAHSSRKLLPLLPFSLLIRRNLMSRGHPGFFIPARAVRILRRSALPPAITSLLII